MLRFLGLGWRWELKNSRMRITRTGAKASLSVSGIIVPSQHTKADYGAVEPILRVKEIVARLPLNINENDFWDLFLFISLFLFMWLYRKFVCRPYGCTKALGICLCNFLIRSKWERLPEMTGSSGNRYHKTMRQVLCSFSSSFYFRSYCVYLNGCGFKVAILRLCTR